MPVIGRISVGDGATFTPAIDSDGVLTFSNNKNLPNPEPFDVPGAVINSGAMTPGSENGTIAFGGNDVAVTGWDTKANVASPAFTGTPTAPTPASEDNTTKIATTAYVQGEKTSAISTANDYTDEQIRQHGNLPVGYEYFTFNPSIPQGSLPLFGGTYSRETYADLWAWVQEQTGYLKTEAQWQALSTANAGNVPYYSDGDGSTTFRVPSMKCWVKGANGTVSEVGSYLAAGLPNITGSYRYREATGVDVNTDFSGAITGGGYVGENAGNLLNQTSTSTKKKLLTFNASNSNSIYGNSTTVQPESIVGMWLVKAYGVIVDTGQIDEQQYIDDRIATRLPLTGGMMTGAIKGNTVTLTAESGGDSSSLVLGADGSMTWDGQNVITAPNGEFIKFISFSLNGSVAANSWSDYSAAIPFPQGYSHVVGVTKINVPSPSNMKLVGFWQSGNDFVVRVYSAAVISGTVDVILSVCK